MDKDKGFTLVELLMVVIILGILVSLALPNYMAGVEKTKAGKAKQSMQAIRSSESWYRAHMDEYVADITVLQEWGLPLNAILADQDWAYTVDTADAIDLLIRATRQNGPFTGESITMDEEGALAVSVAGTPWMVK